MSITPHVIGITLEVGFERAALALNTARAVAVEFRDDDVTGQIVNVHEVSTIPRARS